MLSVVAFAIALAAPAAICDYDVEPKVAFDPSTFVFEGRVVGFATDSVRLSHRAWLAPETLVPGENPHAAGLLVEPLTVVNLPERAEVYAVFPAGIGAACELALASLGDLEQTYTVGDTLAVVAHPPPARDPKSQPLFAPFPAGPVPLLAGSRGGGLIVRAAALGGSQFLAAWGMERRDVPTMQESQMYWVRSGSDEPTWLYRLQYEYERDLAALHGAGALSERVGLLAKVRRYWFTEERPLGDRYPDCAYTALVQQYTVGSEEADEVGGFLLRRGLRPLASAEACAAAERMRIEAEERHRREAQDRR